MESARFVADTEAWILHQGESKRQGRRFERGLYRLPEPGPDSVLVRPLYGSWEGNMDHAVRASPVDVCELRGEPTVVIGNAGAVVEVEAVGANVPDFSTGMSPWLSATETRTDTATRQPSLDTTRLVRSDFWPDGRSCPSTN